MLHPGGGKHKSESPNGAGRNWRALPQLIVPFKRKGYREVADEFRDIATK